MAKRGDENSEKYYKRGWERDQRIPPITRHVEQWELQDVVRNLIRELKVDDQFEKEIAENLFATYVKDVKYYPHTFLRVGVYLSSFDVDSIEIIRLSGGRWYVYSDAKRFTPIICADEECVMGLIGRRKINQIFLEIDSEPYLIYDWGFPFDYFIGDQEVTPSEYDDYIRESKKELRKKMIPELAGISEEYFGE